MAANPQPSNSLDTVMLKRLVEIDKRRKELDAEAKQLNAERAQLEPGLITMLEQVGMDSASVDGRTIYIRRQLWARAAEGDMAGLCRRLSEDPILGNLITETVNTSKLSAHFREQVEWKLTELGDLGQRQEVIEGIKAFYGDVLELADAITLQTRSK